MTVWGRGAEIGHFCLEKGKEIVNLDSEVYGRDMDPQGAYEGDRGRSTRLRISSINSICFLELEMADRSCRRSGNETPVPDLYLPDLSQLIPEIDFMVTFGVSSTNKR